MIDIRLKMNDISYYYTFTNVPRMGVAHIQFLR